ncbi:TRNA (cytosine(34)-C(5))-methyltransferase [Aphelenchoides besseyi]|nr:TRNA (cytosine(34)-C(5))-methyltransferase [Aphelenchoides besseyi]
MDTGDAQAKNGRKKRGAKKNKQQAGVRGNYVLPHILKENDSFFNYVRAQNIVSEDELEQFKTILKTDLPASFRINRSLPEKDEFVKFLKSKFFEPLRQIEDPEIHCPEEIEFVPYAYQTSNSRSAIRSSHLLSDLHQLLITETAAGNISRQEAVSMLPPLLLDVQPHHWVLDSCASPGSKTMQICEMMHEGNNKPEGLLVANDVDNSRCYLLVHQTLKRLPTANCVIVNHDASMLPAPLDSDGNPRLFDRVLCDVICSGDGTFRKNVELWKQWNPNKGVALHKLQQNIASRCLELLKPDGLMVYSTCSLNPIEDEAVVARLLKKFDGCLELVDVSDQLPKLKRANGVSTWKVFSSRMVEYATYEEAQKAGDKSIVPSMFPPTVEEAEKLHLNRSFRILPHVHNTGGFFIAVIRKVKEFSENLNPTPTSVARRVPAKKRRTVKEDPFVFLTNNCDDLKKSLVENYGADESFPWSNLLSRNENMDKKNAVYFVNDALRDFLKFNLERFNVVNAGVNTFRKVDKIGCCDFRLAQDSISTILPYIHKRIIDLDSDTVAKIIAGHDDKHFCPLDQLDFKDKLTGYSPGTVILRMQTAGFTKAISAWLGSLTVSAFISREEKVHLLTMLGKDTSKLQTVLSTSRRQKSDKQRNTTNENNTKNGDEEAMDVEVVKEKVKEEVKEEVNED